MKEIKMRDEVKSYKDVKYDFISSVVAFDLSDKTADDYERFTLSCGQAFRYGSGLDFEDIRDAIERGVNKSRGGVREQANPAGCEPAIDRIDTDTSPHTIS